MSKMISKCSISKYLLLRASVPLVLHSKNRELLNLLRASNVELLHKLREYTF